MGVIPYDPDWPRRFEDERVVLERVLAPWLQDGVHHVGSTAVPGLAAKPIIDMIAGVRDLEEARAAFEPLRELSYQYTPHRPRAHCFHKPESLGWWEQTHHLHLTEPGTDLWLERLAFRDALRADATLAAEYEAWKLEHVQEPGSPGAYVADKRPFVARVLAAVGVDLPAVSPRDSSTSH